MGLMRWETMAYENEDGIRNCKWFNMNIEEWNCQILMFDEFTMKWWKRNIHCFSSMLTGCNQRHVFIEGEYSHSWCEFNEYRWSHCIRWTNLLKKFERMEHIFRLDSTVGETRGKISKRFPCKANFALDWKTREVWIFNFNSQFSHDGTNHFNVEIEPFLMLKDFESGAHLLDNCLLDFCCYFILEVPYQKYMVGV